MDVQLALITSTKVTIGIVCPLCFHKKFPSTSTFGISFVLAQHFLQQPTHHSGHPTLEALLVLGALDIMVRFCIRLSWHSNGCPCGSSAILTRLIALLLCVDV